MARVSTLCNDIRQMGRLLACQLFETAHKPSIYTTLLVSILRQMQAQCEASQRPRLLVHQWLDHPRTCLLGTIMASIRSSVAVPDRPKLAFHHRSPPRSAMARITASSLSSTATDPVAHLASASPSSSGRPWVPRSWLSTDG